MIGSNSQVVADMLALKDIYVAELANGTRAYVRTGVPTLVNAVYQLNKFSGAIENLVTGEVVAPRQGAPIAGAASARWLLCPCAPPIA